MNKREFVKKYVRSPIVLSKVEKGQPYCMIDYTEPLKYTEVVATTDGKDLYNESLLVKDSDNNIFELFPEIQFLDYTKILGRSRKKLPKNYCLVYSFDGDNLKQVKELLDKGNGVAVVFKESLPKKLGKYKVIDGDLSDLRFLDKKMFKIKKEEGYIIGLTYKKNKLDNESNNLKNNFIYDSQKHKF
jgi:hypothetical protein